MDIGFKTHSLRHTAASIIYEYVTQDIKIIKNFLGHDSIEGTQIYIHISEETIKKAFYSNPLSDLTFNKSNIKKKGGRK